MIRRFLPNKQAASRWLLLFMAAAVSLYAVQVIRTVSTRGLFEYIGIDYGLYRATAKAIVNDGFDKAYDLSVMKRYQRPLYYRYSHGPAMGMHFMFSVVPYLPVFFLPLLVIPLFSPVSGFIFWTVANAILILCSSMRLAKCFRCDNRFLTAAAFLLSFPAFYALFFGNVSSWLLPFLGEFMIAFIGGREFTSGLWLGGLLLKPQTLVVLLPGLLIRKRFRVMIGFMAAAAVIIIVSLGLLGVDGIRAYLDSFSSMGRDEALVFPQTMMNWRALGINLEPVLGETVSMILVVAGISLTFMASLLFWKISDLCSPDSFAALVLGSYAATAVIAWHSYIHMALPLAAPLLYLTARRLLPAGTLGVWAFAVPIPFVALTVAVHSGWAHFLAGMSYFILNMALIGIAGALVFRLDRAGRPGQSVCVPSGGERQINHLQPDVRAFRGPGKV